jgi:hypothetical protein
MSWRQLFITNEDCIGSRNCGNLDNKVWMNRIASLICILTAFCSGLIQSWEILGSVTLLYFSVKWWTNFFWKIHYILQTVQVVLNFCSNIDLYRYALIMKNVSYQDLNYRTDPEETNSTTEEYPGSLSYVRGVGMVNLGDWVTAPFSFSRVWSIKQTNQAGLLARWKI